MSAQFPHRIALLLSVLTLLAACSREPEPSAPVTAAATADAATTDMPPMQPRPDNLGPSVKWPAESPRYQQVRREAYREGVDFENTVKQDSSLLSRQQRYRVTLVQVPQHRVMQAESWLIRIATPDGTPVTGASVNVMGGMPEHGHGLPSQPAVQAGTGNGEYRIEGLSFNMPGWWEVSLYISHQKRDDTVTFNLIAG